jgi:hypothetical protein
MWKTEMVTIVRHLIDDTDFSSPTYPDERIEQTILVAGQLIQTEIRFEQDYLINVEKCTISPDPTAADAKDDGFINLVCLKAACIVIGAEFKANAKNAVRVGDGPSSIDMGGSATHLKSLYDSVTKQYEQYKMNFASSNGVGKAVLSPYGSWGYR